MAIDPGKNGGIAWESSYDGIEKRSKADKMPDGMCALYDYLDLYEEGMWICYLEDVGFHMQGNNASSSVKFGKHVGHLEMALYACDLPVKKVHPKVWQRVVFEGKFPKKKHYKELTPPQFKTVQKNFTKDAMQALHPHLKVTLATSDALAILEYAKKQEGGK